MPIRPENVKRYPENWDEIRAQVLARAGDRCEGNGIHCQVQHLAYGYREPDGRFVHVSMDKDEAIRKAGTKKLIRIVLTIAHLDHVPENCGLENLRAWCQQCHNRYDIPHRVANRKKNREAGNAG